MQGVPPDSVLRGRRGVLGPGWTVPGVAGGATRFTAATGRGPRRRCTALVAIAEPYGPHRTHR